MAFVTAPASLHLEDFRPGRRFTSGTRTIIADDRTVGCRLDVPPGVGQYPIARTARARTARTRAPQPAPRPKGGS